ncbi:phospholipase A2 [Betta splendens]|uniref:Phospholipase A2 n=1 Tax=Betta splendens TaxID=158456 RepID=A0A6P7NIN3_BETSP|nr:phospholipase A2 [Betta splendens]
MTSTSRPPLLLLLAACVAGGALRPRAMWQLGQTIQCVQPDVNPLRYNDYGCWCGFGGTGTPRDGVDTCCKAHDECYHASRTTPGCTAVADLPYILVYDFSCSDRQVVCLDTNDKCQAAVCECDRVAAHCFAQHTYDPKNKNLDPKVHCVD